MENRYKIAFVVSGSFRGKVIGGHLLSAIAIAKQLAKLGHHTTVIADMPEKPFYDLEEAHVQIELLPWNFSNQLFGSRIWLHFTRMISLYRLLHNQDVVVTVDSYATLHAGPSVPFRSLSFVQIVPGGPAPTHMPLSYPGLIVFSEELFDEFTETYNISSNHLILSSGRVDFGAIDKVINELNNDVPLMASHPLRPLILVVSRLTKDKEKAILTILDEVNQANLVEPLQIVIIGDGDSRSFLEQKAKEITYTKKDKITINFLGSKRVAPGDLLQADLVVGQGRTVIEAIACKVPAAVCGNNGYIGLITPANLSSLAVTNLTGRNIKKITSLDDDIAYIKRDREYLDTLYELAECRFDARQGAYAVEQAYIAINSKFSRPVQRNWYFLKAYIGFLVMWVRRTVANIVG